MKFHDFIILDFETTGLSPSQSELIEVAAIRVSGLEPGLEKIETYSSLIRPSEPIPRMITQLTGISNDDVKDAPVLSEVASEFLDFIGQMPLVSHNSSIEEGFLNEHLAPHRGGEAFEVHNTIEPIALILPEAPSFSMEYLRKWAGIKNEGSHRALKDCEDLLEILKRMRELLVSERASHASIVERFLGDIWFWDGFFSSVKSAARLEPENETADLQKLKNADQKKEPNWEAGVTDRELEEIFRLSSEELGLEFRSAQLQMSQRISEAFSSGDRVAIEAPTGVGKSLAYLVPGYYSAKASGAPLVVATHSKSLQDQLIKKDIPLLSRLLKTEVKAAVVKGQNNYLCLRKLNEHADEMSSQLAQIRAPAKLIEEESQKSEKFDYEEFWSTAYLLCLAETSDRVDLNQVSPYLKYQMKSLFRSVEQVRSNYLTTVGPKCPYYKSCHFYNSARRAHEAELIVANHALAFSWPTHLPKVRTIIFDEAHHLEDQMTSAFSVSLKEEDVIGLLDRLKKKRGKRKSDLNHLAGVLKHLKVAIPAEEDPKVWLEDWAKAVRAELKDIRRLIPESRIAAIPSCLNLSQSPDPLILEPMRRTLSLLRDASKVFSEAREKEKTPHSDRLAFFLDRTLTFTGAFEALATSQEEDPNRLRLLYRNGRTDSFHFSVIPIEVREKSDEVFQDKHAVILTSATLSAGTSREFLSSRIGLTLGEPLIQLDSPFDLGNQAKLHIPTDTPKPGTPEHLEALIDFTAKTAIQLGGRTLLLITSNVRLRQAAEALRERLKGEGIRVFDSITDNRAAENFRNTDRALLIGSEKYGEGLDLPGQQLSCVIIEKINEAMTRGELADARKNRSRFAIYDYDFPLRMIWLKQRIGRLIRSPEDRGSIVLFDSRYHAWSKRSQAFVDQTAAPIPIRSETRESILGHFNELA